MLRLIPIRYRIECAQSLGVRRLDALSGESLSYLRASGLAVRAESCFRVNYIMHRSQVQQTRYGTRWRSGYALRSSEGFSTRVCVGVQEAMGKKRN